MMISLRLRRWVKPVVAACLVLSLHPARAATLLRIPLAAAGWQTQGHVEFSRIEGFPNGLMQLRDEAGAVLLHQDFGNGTIEFDIRLLGDGIPGIRFRRRGPGTSEVFYLRSDPNCRAADDCIQYVPIVHGVMPWDMYPQYQSAAPVLPTDWNHIRLVVSAHRMNIFVNRSATPTLAIGRLEGDAPDGGIEFTGPAAIANLTLAPGVTDGLSEAPLPDPTRADPGLVRHWQVSPPSPLALGQAPPFAGFQAVSSWRSLATEANGLLNLSRLYGSPTDSSTGALVWVKTHIVSDRAQTRHVSLAYLREAWVFANGKPVFAGENLYYPEKARLDADARLSPGNGSFDLPLRKGDNEIAVAVNNILGTGHRHWGWGLELRLDNVEGLNLPKR